MPAPAITRMGYEAQILYGTPGTTATNQLTIAGDFDYNVDPERGDTTPRGDGSSVPIVTSRVTALKPTVTFKLFNRPTDANLIALLAACSTGAPVAIRTKSYASGKGYDGDMTLSFKEGAPVKGEGTFDFTGEASEESGRSPQLWV